MSHLTVYLINRLNKTESAFSNLWNLFGILFDTGYPHDGRVDKDSYPHDGRADKDSYRHDRLIHTTGITNTLC